MQQNQERVSSFEELGSSWGRREQKYIHEMKTNKKELVLIEIPIGKLL